ncbi:prolipoprotein diacylglyceryl transferase [Patescibacteria group bacterium]|nr:prolipoprotein diacylglyceryl transferase [Patescibacteria group bacterium]
MIPYFVIDQIVLGPVKLYTWGLFVGLGFSAGYLLFYYLVRREGLAPTKIAGLSLAIFVGAILGAKILAVATLSGANWQAIFSAPSGASFLGGLIGAIVCGVLYVLLIQLNSPHPHFISPSRAREGEREGVGFWRIADLLVLPTALGIGLGRIGCALINDHQGAVTNLPWGILWPDGLVRHPIGIYESLVGFGLLAVFWWVRKKIKSTSLRGAPLRLSGAAQVQIPRFARDRLRNPVDGGNITGLPRFLRSLAMTDGFLFLLFLLSYSALRFFLEFTRVSTGPLADPRWGVFSVSQWITLLIFGFVVVLLASRKRQG